MEQIGEILRRLRMERGFTQTEVAAAISVTSQAVSKWENGTGLPDVSQLVPLADFFGVTADCILGRRDNAAEEEIRGFLSSYDDVVCHARYLSESQHITVKEAFDSILDNARKMLRKYPNDFRLMINICQIIFFAPKEGGFDDTPYAFELYGELTDLGEKILEHCADQKIRNDAVWFLAVTYPYQNRYDKIKALAENAPPMHGCREALLCDAAEYGTEEHRKYNEEYLHHCMKHIHFALWSWYYRKNCSPEERLAPADMEWKIYHAYYDRRDFDGWRAGTLFENRLYAARAYLVLNNAAAAESAIQEGFNLLTSVIADESASYTSTAMTMIDEKITWHRNDGCPNWVREMAQEFKKDTGLDITDRLEAVLTDA